MVVMTLDTEKLRKDFPITERCIYFNSGWAGPSPTPVVEAIAETLRREASLGPASKRFLSEVEEETTGLRNDLGNLLGAGREEFALTHSTGDGLNIVYSGIDWKKGDRAITTNLEHVANILPLMRLRKRLGVDVVEVEADQDGLFDPGGFEEAINEKTKLVTISHVIYMVGTVLPAKEITKIAHEHNVPVLLDMAQSAGCIQINLKEIGCDYAAARGGKWLLGPGGTGFLYVDLKQLESLSQASIGYQGARTEGSEYAPHPDARRFEISELNAPIYGGLRRAIKYHTDIGKGNVEKRVRSLAGYLIEKANQTPNLRVLGTQNLDLKNGLVTLQVKGQNAAELVPMLESKHGIVARAVPKFNAVRISLHIFNTEGEVDALINTLKSL